MIQICNLMKSYTIDNKNYTVLNSINLNINEG